MFLPEIKNLPYMSACADKNSDYTLIILKIIDDLITGVLKQSRKNVHIEYENKQYVNIASVVNVIANRNRVCVAYFGHAKGIELYEYLRKSIALLVDNNILSRYSVGTSAYVRNNTLEIPHVQV